jgi:hypothetical protein
MIFSRGWVMVRVPDSSKRVRCWVPNALSGHRHEGPRGRASPLLAPDGGNGRGRVPHGVGGTLLPEWSTGSTRRFLTREGPDGDNWFVGWCGWWHEDDQPKRCAVGGAGSSWGYSCRVLNCVGCSGRSVAPVALRALRTRPELPVSCSSGTSATLRCRTTRRQRVTGAPNGARGSGCCTDATSDWLQRLSCTEVFR